MDAPVSGGDIGARNGTLAIMVGGERKAYEECLPIFQIMGENIQYQGLSRQRAAYENVQPNRDCRRNDRRCGGDGLRQNIRS
ncbi:NAD(P)-binding domain-containing protein [Bacillus sonorensis]|nr:NAD(P)-binding domain-containing protein [Bacillus sonorensis]